MLVNLNPNLTSYGKIKERIMELIKLRARPLEGLGRDAK
jgi:hypothetical protein